MVTAFAILAMFLVFLVPLVPRPLLTQGLNTLSPLSTVATLSQNLNANFLWNTFSTFQCSQQQLWHFRKFLWNDATISQHFNAAKNQKKLQHFSKSQCSCYQLLNLIVEANFLWNAAKNAVTRWDTFLKARNTAASNNKKNYDTFSKSESKYSSKI